MAAKLTVSLRRDRIGDMSEMRPLNSSGGGPPKGGFTVRFLRAAGLVGVPAGAVGSLAFMLYAGRHQSSRILLVLFAAWVLSPFMAPVLIKVVWQRWFVLTRGTLNVTMLVITLGSLSIYGDVALGYTKAKIGFVFLIVPLISWLLIAVVVPIAALVARRQTH